MKLAVYTVSLPEYNIEESVALIKEMGYDGVEWRVESTAKIPLSNFPAGVDPFTIRYWADNQSTLDIHNVMADCLRAKALCDEANLEIVNLAGAIGSEETLEQVLEAAAAIGCKSVRGPMTAYKADQPYDEQFRAAREYLLRVEPMLRKHGVKMLLETHHGMLTASASATMRLLEGLDPDCFGVIFDPGNMVFEGYEDYHKSFQMLGSYLAHVHVKNAALIPNGEDALGTTTYSKDWMPLWKGSADLKYLVECLVKIGYQGCLSVEDFSNEQPTREKLEANIAYLKKLIAAAEAK